MGKRIYFVKLGGMERGPFTRSEIAFLCSSDVLALDERARVEKSDQPLTVREIVFPFAEELMNRGPAVKLEQPVRQEPGPTTPANGSSAR
jgi:hypothetical protein